MGRTYVRTWESPLGEMLLESDGESLTGAWFAHGSREERAGELPGPTDEGCPVLDEATSWLGDYFAGRRPEPLPPVSLAGRGTAFRRAAWEELSRIPYGETTSYGELARRVGERLGRRTSARAVGGAVGRNPVCVVVPCHRVVAADGAFTGFGAGVWRKRALLGLERDGLLVAEAPERGERLVAALAGVWETSVRATHDFLAPGAVEAMAGFVPEAIRGVGNLLVAWRGGAPVAFLGEEAGRIEMLFVAPRERGTGLGRELVARAVGELGAREVDANEQNGQAVGFYEHLGFRTYERTDVDDQGQPYPLLRMRLQDR